MLSGFFSHVTFFVIIFRSQTGVKPHVHVLLPGPGTGHPAGGQQLAAQGRHRVSGVRGAMRRRRQFRRHRRQVQATVRGADDGAVSPRTAGVRQRGRSGRHGRVRSRRRHRRGHATSDLDVNIITFLFQYISFLFYIILN